MKKYAILENHFSWDYELVTTNYKKAKKEFKKHPYGELHILEENNDNIVLVEVIEHTNKWRIKHDNNLQFSTGSGYIFKYKISY